MTRMIKLPDLKKIRRANTGLRVKILFSISAILVSTLSILIIVIVVNYSSKLENDNVTVANQSIRNVTSNINDYFDEIIGVTNHAVFNNDFQNFLSTEDYMKKLNPDAPDLVEAGKIGTEVFGNSFDSRSNITAVVVFNQNGVLMYTSPYEMQSTLSDFKKQIWYTAAVKAQGKAVITGIFDHSSLTGDHASVFSVSRLIWPVDSNTPPGVILIDANLNTITNICNSVNLDKDGLLFIADGSGKLVRSPDNAPKSVDSAALHKKLFAKFKRSSSGNFGITAAGEEYQVVYRRMTYCNWTVFAMTPYRSLVADLSSITKMIVLVGVICLILAIILSFFLLNHIVHPLFELKKYMDIWNNGSRGFYAPVRTRDEIGMVTSSYNRMLERIYSLSDEIIAEQKKLRKAELMALQSQINPHFLYNTLDTIVWMAEMKDPRIVSTTEALAKFFRISLSKGKDLITLAEELEHVRNYLVIQSVRYGNKFTYEIFAEESVLSYKTLKIILQPIVENAIYHGMKNAPYKGKIRIDALERAGQLVITVFDNGIGMDSETCAKLLDGSYQKNESGGSGVGVKNVSERIRLYFGDAYGIAIESRPGEGTVVTINLPVIGD